MKRINRQYKKMKISLNSQMFIILNVKKPNYLTILKYITQIHKNCTIQFFLQNELK